MSARLLSSRKASEQTKQIWGKSNICDFSLGNPASGILHYHSRDDVNLPVGKSASGVAFVEK
jgi:hypothetical protein